MTSHSQESALPSEEQKHMMALAKNPGDFHATMGLLELVLKAV